MTKRDEIIEAMTKAIAARHRVSVQDVPAIMQGPHRLDAEVALDAALRVMSEPSEDMVDAGITEFEAGSRLMRNSIVAALSALQEGKR